MTTTTAAAAALPADWRDFLALTKPRVMTLVVFTGLCGLLAAPARPPRSTNGMKRTSTR